MPAGEAAARTSVAAGRTSEPAPTSALAPVLLTRACSERYYLLYLITAAVVCSLRFS
jgi:hypothetical protein